MIICPSCSAQNSEASKFCSECGAALSAEFAPTMVPVSSTKSEDSGSNSSSVHGRFLPGTKILDRYRIVSLLGRGGMGEVYRADDLKLGHTVALKFLPEKLAEQRQRLEYFLSEVRLSRQVSHPNVCRVYDIGEVDGLHFLSMEYIDGEDLKALLRRIGRFPGERGTEIAQQLCAGLASAHERGVLHRDLKPANVMLDGRGQVRITDFGLARLADDDPTGEIAGTPAYMAPEQLKSGETSVQSDLYSLGLILYEIFTGRQLFTASSRADQLRLHEDSALTKPSEIVSDLDPAIERVILRCLELNPRQRPQSAHLVGAALPGGDPLAAALAAGETPSPELVAASGEKTGLQPRVAIALLLGIIGLLIAQFPLEDMTSPAGWTKLEKRPEELAAIARDLIVDLGHDEKVGDVVYGFSEVVEITDYVKANYTAEQFWSDRAAGRIPAIRFWYRRSPRNLVPQQSIGHSYSVTPDNPPQNLPGMAFVNLDGEGRLVNFRMTPQELVQGQGDDQPGLATEQIWQALFGAAGLSYVDAESVSPVWTPPDYADERAAWKGLIDPHRPELELRVEAAVFQGRPTAFRVIEPWSTPRRGESEQDSGSIGANMVFFLMVAVLVTAIVVAWRNVRLKRGDRHGARRLFLWVAAMHFVNWLVNTPHLLHRDELMLIFSGLSECLFWGCLIWTIYLALEPYMRRIWPQLLISWSRLQSGQFRDPLIGRDLLFGIGGGLAANTLFSLSLLIPVWLGLAAPAMSNGMSAFSVSKYIAHIADLTGDATFIALTFHLFFLLILRVLLKRQWLAMGAWWIFVSIAFSFMTGGTIWNWLLVPIAMAIVITVVSRFGLLAAITMSATRNIFWYPVTSDTSSWYFGYGLTSALIVLAFALYGFFVSLGNQSLFADPFADDQDR